MQNISLVLQLQKYEKYSNCQKQIVSEKKNGVFLCRPFRAQMSCVVALKQGLTPLPVVLKFSAPFGRYRNCHWQFLHPYGVIVLRPAGYRKVY